MSTPPVQKRGAQGPAYEQFKPLARAIFSLRKTAGLTSKVTITPIDDDRPEKRGIRVADERASFRPVVLRSERDIVQWLKSGHEIWEDHDPEKLVQKFREILRGKDEPKKKAGPKEPGEADKADEPDDDWKDGYAAVQYPVIDKLLHAMHPGLLRVYLALIRFESYEKGTMFPGQERIAKLAGLADRQTRKYLHALRDVGLITIKRQGYFKGRENMPNLYQRVPVTRENWSQILAKLEAWSLPRMSKADRKRLSSTDRHR
jgi:hypothetical protein